MCTRIYLPVAWDRGKACLPHLDVDCLPTELLPGILVGSDQEGLQVTCAVPDWAPTLCSTQTWVEKTDITLTLEGLLTSKKSPLLQTAWYSSQDMLTVCAYLVNYILCTLPLISHGVLYTWFLLCLLTLLLRVQGFSAGCKKEISACINSPGPFSSACEMSVCVFLWVVCLHCLNW